jgi:hypothetical protein
LDAPREKYARQEGGQEPPVALFLVFYAHGIRIESQVDGVKALIAPLKNSARATVKTLE